MKHLVFVIDNLSGGGAERIVLTLASALNTMGHQAIIVTLSQEIEHEVPGNVVIHNVPQPKSRLGKVGQYRRHAKALNQKLQQLHQQTPINLVVSNLPRTDRITHYIKGFNLYFCIHNTYSSEYLDNKTGLSRWFKYQKIKRTYRNKNIIAVSKGVERDIVDTLQLPIKTSVQIYNPFSMTETQALACHSATVDYGEYIIHVGRINRQKRHDRLLRVYKNSEAFANVKLVIIGSGSEADQHQLEKQIRENGLEEHVVLHGFEKNPFPLIKQAKALLLTSDFEGFGNILVESLICGTPVISTNCPSGPNEILIGDLSKFLIETHNEDAYAKALAELLQRPPEIRPEHFERFSVTTIAEEYLALAN